jgi:serine/threonine-protein kinase
MQSDDTRAAAAINSFLRELSADRAAGRTRPLEAYLQRYPGFEQLLTAEYERLSGAGPGDEPPPRMRFPPPFADGSIGPYRLERELGRGGQGLVYLARDTRLERTVAIKLLTGTALFSADSLKRFEREAALAARLDHPGICAVYEVGELERVPYVVMRHVQGETLAQLLGRIRDHEAPRPDVDWCLSFVARAADALQVAHEAGVIHRDVKPGNLMVTPGGEPVVLDFGLARELEGDSLTRSGDLFGTPTYMAPEQIDTRVPPDARTDVYSLGASLYDLLTLRPPFKAPTREGLFHQILTERPANPRSVNRTISRDLRVVLDTALEKEPDRRYQTARDFAEDLRAVREGRPIAARPVGPFGRIVRWAQRETAAASLAGSALVGLMLAAGLGGYLLARRPVLEAGQRVFDRREREALVTAAWAGRFSDQSEESMRAILEAEPGHGAVRGVLALLYYKRGQHDSALQVLDAATPDTDTPRLLGRIRASVLAAQGRVDEAKQLELELGEPREPYECWWVARQLLDADPLGGQAPARPLLERAIYLSPEPKETFFNDLIRASSSDQETMDRAADALERNHADSALAWFSIAMARVQRDPGAALSALERSLEIDPEFQQALTMLAIFRLQSGELEQALELHERGMASPMGSFTERSILRHTFAEMLEGAGYEDAALEQLERLLEEDPDHVETLLLRGELLVRSGFPRQARSSFERALELEPDSARARAGLGH